MPLTSIIIPAYRQAELTRQCLTSLAGSLGDLFDSTQVVLVDNAFGLEPEISKKTAILGQSLFGGNFVWLPQAENVNFAGACNLGAKASCGSYICFLNNDTIQSEGWLTTLLRNLKGQGGEWDVVGPLLLYPPGYDGVWPGDYGKGGTVQHLGVAITPSMRLLHLYEHIPGWHALCRRREVSILTGACFVLERALFLRVGGFDEDFRNGFEDVDFCLRLKGEAPVRLACFPEAVVWHLCGQSPGRSDNEIYNTDLMAAKHKTGEPEGDSGWCYLPDYQDFLAEDGLELGLTPWLTWQISDPRAMPRLDAWLLKKPALSEVGEALAATPFWLAGWLYLARQEPDADLAIEWARQAIKFGLGPEPVLLLRRLAQARGQFDLVARMSARLNFFVIDPDERVRTIRHLRAGFRRSCPSMVSAVDKTLNGLSEFLRVDYPAFLQERG